MDIPPGRDNVIPCPLDTTLVSVPQRDRQADLNTRDGVLGKIIVLKGNLHIQLWKD